MHGIKGAWHRWAEEAPNSYRSFRKYARNLRRKDKISASHCISGVIDINGDIDEYALEQYLTCEEDPIPCDLFVRMNS